MSNITMVAQGKPAPRTALDDTSHRYTGAFISYLFTAWVQRRNTVPLMHNATDAEKEAAAHINLHLPDDMSITYCDAYRMDIDFKTIFGQRFTDDIRLAWEWQIKSIIQQALNYAAMPGSIVVSHYYGTFNLRATYYINFSNMQMELFNRSQRGKQAQWKAGRK